MTPYGNATGWTAPISSPDLIGADVAGPSVRITRCIAALAQPLSGVPDQWQLFAVTPSG
jgi:hypothetical protein